jgi:hypothetical protein
MGLGQGRQLLVARMTLEEIDEAGFAEVCCEAMEAALEAGVMRLDKLRGILYLKAPGRYWRIAFCPCCGVAR